MNEVNMTFLINSISLAIAEPLTDEELAIASAIFTQIGDTLATIALTRNSN